MKNLNKKLCVCAVRAADNSLANLAFIYTKQNTERSLYTQIFAFDLYIYLVHVMKTTTKLLLKLRNTQWLS